MSALPVVLVPVGVDDDALDACLAALDAGTPAGTRVWLADDAQAGPRGLAIVERWLARTALQADYTRRPRPIGEAAHLDDMLKACGDADVLVLSSDAVPCPGWATQLVACAARAAAALPPHHPELPAAVDHALFLRGSARRKAGGLDAASYASSYVALIDLSLRMAGLGWRNALCETAFVARRGEGRPLGDDVETLGVRWPTWHARLAQFLMQDPLHALRASLGHAFDNAELRTQPDLFARPDPEQEADAAGVGTVDGSSP